MLSTPEINATLGNKQYTSHVFAAQITQGLLPATNSARLLFPARVAIEAAPGAEARLSLGTDNGTANINTTTVLTGRVQSVSRRPDHTLVTLSDGSLALSHYRPGATFEQQSASAIVQTLAADVEVTVGRSGINLDLAQYAAHQGRTAAEHIAHLASFGDGYAFVDGDGQLQVHQWPDGPADAAIRHGRDLIDFHFSSRQKQASVAPIGNGPAGSTSAPDALRQDTGSLLASTPEPGQDTVWQAAPMLRTPAAVQTAQTGLNRLRQQQAGQATMAGLLRPDFRPGTKLQVQEIDGIEPLWIVIRLTHEIVHGSYARTVMQARQAAGASLAVQEAALGALV